MPEKLNAPTYGVLLRSFLLCVKDACLHRADEELAAICSEALEALDSLERDGAELLAKKIPGKAPEGEFRLCLAALPIPEKARLAKSGEEIGVWDTLRETHLFLRSNGIGLAPRSFDEAWSLIEAAQIGSQTLEPESEDQSSASGRRL